MIEWYSDDDIEILFDKVPNVTIRYVTPFTTNEEKKEIKCYEYDEWLIMDVFIGDKLVYMKPFENKGAYYWISSDDIINMENAGTYIGPLSTIEFDTIGMEEIS